MDGIYIITQWMEYIFNDVKGIDNEMLDKIWYQLFNLFAYNLSGFQGGFFDFFIDSFFFLFFFNFG